MSLMACVIISRLTNYAAKGLASSFYMGSTRCLSTSSPFCAAPNVVVYASDNENKFFKINTLLQQVFSADSLAVYPLSRESLLKHDAAWLQNVRGLVLDDQDRLGREETQRLLSFLKKGGRILDLGSNLCKHIGIARGEAVLDSESDRPLVKIGGEILVKPKGFFSQKVLKVKPEDWSLRPALNDSTGKIVAIEVFHQQSKGRAILCRVPFHLSGPEQQFNAESMDAFEKQGPKRNEILLNLFKKLEIIPKSYSKQVHKQPIDVKMTDESVIAFGKHASRIVGALSSVDHFKTIQSGGDGVKTFTAKDYFDTLKTRSLGNAVIYQPVCDTTMNLVKEARNHILGNDVGIVAISDRQSNGKGRAGNKWLSPDGCAMFTFGLSVDPDSGLGKRLPLVQSIAGLACVTAIKELTTKGPRSDIDVKIKWPNDIYFGGTVKLGGILVQSTILGSTIHCSVGIGLNLDNEEPTMCLNRILKSHGLPSISRERLIATTLNNFEKFADAVNSYKLDDVIGAYCSNWLHNDQRVVVREESQADYCNVPSRRTPQPMNVVAEPPSSLRSGYVRRIDEYGYLVVEFPDRTLASLHPDGNSFDAMNGLILPKLIQAESSSSCVPKLGDEEYPRTKNVHGMVYQVR